MNTYALPAGCVEGVPPVLCEFDCDSGNHIVTWINNFNELNHCRFINYESTVFKCMEKRCACKLNIRANDETAIVIENRPRSELSLRLGVNLVHIYANQDFP